MYRFVVISLVFLLAACNTTQGVGYRNPTYMSYRLTSVAVHVVQADTEFQPTEFSSLLETKVVLALKNRGIDARGTTDLARFSKSLDEFGNKVVALGATEWLIIRYGDQPLASASSYNTTSIGSVTYTTPVLGLNRAVFAKAELLTTKKPEKVWEGDLKRTASGLAFIGDNLTTDELTNALLSALEKDGLILVSSR